ncbi:MAG: hypothetical protein NC184_05315 [Roseburia sp.]|nr:hypothetical protein [Roseburia sp.]
MEKRQYNNLIYILLVVCVVLATVIGGWNINISTAYAESDDVQSTYEQTNVMSNLKDSTIAGKPFDIADFPHSETAKPQIITFVEFCYSYYADKQSDYGLYVYVYNPQDVAIDTNTDRNKIQLTYGNKMGYSKYKLQFLNYSTDAGIEGRFYKFKIVLSTAERNEILKAVSPDERVYKVSGIELSVKNKVTEHGCAQTYTYKGFAVGYGSELAESDTLSCTVDGFDKYLSLDVRSTFWRPDGTHDDLHSRDTLHSVYFSVPNAIVNEYGEMTGVHATWLNAQTAPMIVTGNKTVYNAIEPYIAKHQDAGSSESYPENKTLNYALVTDSDMTYYGHGHYGTLAYNVWTSNDSGKCTQCYDRIIYDLRYLFYADNGNADNYVLPSEKLVGDEKTGAKGWFETYTEKYGAGSGLVNNRFSKDLFDHVDDSFTEVNITANDTFKLSDVTTTTYWWSWLFGPSKPTVTGSSSYNVSAIQKITARDFDTYNKDIFEDKFYVDASDYDELRDYVIESNSKNETVYLFRYYQSIYDGQEARELKFIEDWAIARGKFGNYEEIDTNAYIAQMWVQLDFDIIDLTFTKDNVITKIPVIMSPMDIAADADHPVYTTDDNKGLSWWKILLAILLGILVLILLLKFAPGILTILIKIIFLPFKLIAAIFSGINSATKPSRERRKQRRKDEKERKKLEREAEKERKHNDKIARKERERERKAEEKQRERDHKRELREREKERRREEKEQERKRKQEQKHDKKMWKQAERNYADYVKYDEFPWCPERKQRKKEKQKNKKKLTLADLDGMSDAELAELYYEEYGFDEDLYTSFEDDDYPI